MQMAENCSVLVVFLELRKSSMPRNNYFSTFLKCEKGGPGAVAWFLSQLLIMDIWAVYDNAYVLTILGQHALLFAKFSLPTGSSQRLAKCCHLKSRRLYWSLFEVPGVFQAVLKIGQTCSLIIDGLRYALWIDKSFSCSIFYKRHLLVSVYRCTLHHTWHLQSTACNYRLVKSCQVRWCHAFSIDQYPVSLTSMKLP